MRIIVKNLPLRLKREEIEIIFQKYGQINDIFLVKKENQFTGVCFIGYKSEEDAKKAIEIRNNTYIKNLKIKVEESQIKEREKDSYEANSNKLTVKNLPFDSTESEIKEHFLKYGKIKEIKIYTEISKKANIIFKYKETVSEIISKSEIFKGRRLVFYETPEDKEKTYFNSLFFDFQTIVKRFDTELKNQNFLDDKNLGTNISLLESHLIKETEKFLEKNNIFLDNLTGSRSKNILIVRNYDMLNQKLHCKVKIAPSKNLALLFFKDEEKALIFFREFNLKKIKDKAIHCEFLPLSSSIKQNKSFTNKLIIKNIPFQATKRELKKLFESQIKISNFRLPLKNSDQNVKQHRGFGFLILKSENDAKLVYESFKNTHLYGRKLIIEISE